MQLDTGAPTSIVQANLEEDLSSTIAVSGSFSARPSFLGDTGERVRFSFGMARFSFEIAAAVLRGPKTGRRGYLGLLGLDAIENSIVEVSFALGRIKFSKLHEKSVTKSDAVGAYYWDSIFQKSRRRILINICLPSGCEDVIFDSGVVVADLVEFIPESVFLEKYKNQQVTTFPAFDGVAKCSGLSEISPVVGARQLPALKSTQCALSSYGENVPAEKVFGIRSIVSTMGGFMIDPFEGVLKIEYGASDAAN